LNRRYTLSWSSFTFHERVVAYNPWDYGWYAISMMRCKLPGSGRYKPLPARSIRYPVA
jgi:hypothetical protein